MRPARGWIALLTVLVGEAIASRGGAESLPFTGIPWRDDGGYTTTDLSGWPPAKPSLAGLTVVLDPGHGGRETGTQGPAGLLEKDVNLAVALETARRLRQLGLRVLLTREGDTGVAPPGASLAADLEARAMVANRASADLFVSIHHNASMDPAAPRSQTETYHRLDDAGPSREAAAAIHESLTGSLGLTTNRLSPGFYAVLRNCRVPAVLGEASYLTHPFTEVRLRTPEGIQLEALAYARGILTYLEPGIPAFDGLSEATASPPGNPVLTARVRTTGAPLDVPSVRMTVDGTPVALQVDPGAGRIRGFPGKALASGVHRVELTGKNLAGRTAVPAVFDWRISRRPARLEIRTPFAARPHGGPLPIEVRVLDSLGLPVDPGQNVRFEARDAWTFDPETSARQGWAGTWVMPAGPSPRVTVRLGSLHAAWIAPSRPLETTAGWVRDASGSPVPGVLVYPADDPAAAPASTDRNGAWCFATGSRPPGALRIDGPGIAPIRLRIPATPSFIRVRLETEASDFAPGTRFVIDPAGGPESVDANHRATHLTSHRVAELLCQYLTTAGAQGILTRGPDSTPADLDRIRRSTQATTSAYLRLDHGNAETELRHYPRSVAGEALARRLARELAQASPDATRSAPIPVRAASDLVLIHPPCPSVVAQLPPVSTDEDAWRQAYACFQALQPPRPGAASITLRIHSANRPGTWSVWLDDRWPGRVTTGHRWTFGNLAPGLHRLLLRSDDGTSRPVIVPSLLEGEARLVEVEADRPEIDPHLASRQDASRGARSGTRMNRSRPHGG